MSSRYQKSRPKTKPKYPPSSRNPYYNRSQQQSRPHRNPKPLPKPLPSRSAKSRQARPSRQYISDNNGLGQPSSHHSSHHTQRLSHRHHNTKTQPSSSSKHTSSSNPKQSYRSQPKSSQPSQSSRVPSTYSTRSDSSDHAPLPSDQYSEKPHVQVQHEVSQSTPPNLNLSTYGYSVNARDTTRQKALHDAVDKEGVDAVRSRMMFLIEKYDSQPPVVKILMEDYDWMERYNDINETRHRFDSQREQTRKRIYQRMQEKSKSRRHLSHRH